MSAAIGRRKRRKLKSEINVVPYIDVMLVLLIIFMVTAPLMQQGVEVFHRRHREIYGYGAEDEPAELVNVRVRAVGEIPQLQLREWAPTGVAAPSVREVFFEDSDSWLETPVYDRGTLSSGGTLDGPAIIEQYDSTTVVYPGWRVDVDGHGILSLRRVEG